MLYQGARQKQLIELISQDTETALEARLALGEVLVTHDDVVWGRGIQASWPNLSHNLDDISSAGSHEDKAVELGRRLGTYAALQWADGEEFSKLSSTHQAGLLDVAKFLVRKARADGNRLSVDDAAKPVESAWRSALHAALEPVATALQPKEPKEPEGFDAHVCPWNDECGEKGWWDGADDFVHATLEPYLCDSPPAFALTDALDLVKEEMAEYDDALAALAPRERQQVDSWIEQAARKNLTSHGFLDAS